MLKKFFNLLDNKEEQLPSGDEAKMEIEGMTCGHCSADVEKIVGGIEGVKYAKVDLPSHTGHFVYDADIVSAEAIKEVINSTDKYTAK